MYGKEASRWGPFYGDGDGNGDGEGDRVIEHACVKKCSRWMYVFGFSYTS